MPPRISSIPHSPISRTIPFFVTLYQQLGGSLGAAIWLSGFPSGDRRFLQNSKISLASAGDRRSGDGGREAAPRESRSPRRDETRRDETRPGERSRSLRVLRCVCTQIRLIDSFCVVVCFVCAILASWRIESAWLFPADDTRPGVSRLLHGRVGTGSGRPPRGREWCARQS